MKEPAGRTGPSRSGNCSPSSSGTATPRRTVLPDEALVRRGTSARAGDAMKQVAQNYKSGELTVLDAPAPACRPGGVLVRSLYSLISTGTETMKVTEANLSLLGKARARPDQVRKLMDAIPRQGLRATYTKAMSRLGSYTPLGYSTSGVVVDIGAAADEF